MFIEGRSRIFIRQQKSRDLCNDSTHEHLVVRALVNHAPTNVDEVIAWAVDIVEKLQLTFLHAPIGAYCYDEGNRGVTVIAVLNASHLAVHVWDEPLPALMQLDIYSCKKLAVGEVLSHLRKYSIVKMEYRLFDRSVTIRELFSEP